MKIYLNISGRGSVRRGWGRWIGFCFKYGLGIRELKAKERSRGGLGDSADGKLRKNGVVKALRLN